MPAARASSLSVFQKAWRVSEGCCRLAVCGPEKGVESGWAEEQGGGVEEGLEFFGGDRRERRDALLVALAFDPHITCVQIELMRR